MSLIEQLIKARQKASDSDTARLLDEAAVEIGAGQVRVEAMQAEIERLKALLKMARVAAVTYNIRLSPNEVEQIDASLSDQGKG